MKKPHIVMIVADDLVTITMIMIFIYIAQIPCVYVQMRFTITKNEIEPKVLKAPLAAAIRFLCDLN